MIVLAIDTAGVNCSAALYDSGSAVVLAALQETIGKGHAERLSGMIDEVFGKAGLTPQDIGLIGVTVGPGSFTGIRVGVAAARALSLALGVRAVGMSTLEVLADEARQTLGSVPVLAAIDAKRDEIYLQTFDAFGAPLDEPQALPVADARQKASRMDATPFGSGAAVLADMSVEADQFDIGAVARLAARRPNAPGKPAPLYLRGPDAKPQAGFAIERRA